MRRLHVDKAVIGAQNEHEARGCVDAVCGVAVICASGMAGVSLDSLFSES